MSKTSYMIGHDDFVREWTWRTFRMVRMPVDMAIGLIRDGELVGAAMFQWYNGNNIELNYFGPQTASLRTFRLLARLGLERFDVQRCTVRTEESNQIVIKGALKFGFKVEGREQRFYGPNQHAVRLVLFREDIERIAGYPEQSRVLQSLFMEVS